MKKPVVDLAECNRCGACVEAYPEIFRMNEAGFVEVIEMDAYPQDQVDEAIKYCPEDCIYWEEE
ncbi:MAG: ferredoxin [Desulfobacterales bacterium]|jgi:ferredoxin